MKRFIKAVFPVLVAARVITEPSDVGTKQNVGLDVRDSSALSESLEEGYQVRTTKSDDSSLPRVNLGYEVHQASSHDDKSFWHFDNIPYAEPPIGKLRFQEAVPKTKTGFNNLNKGEVFKICPQMQVGWGSLAVRYIKDLYALPERNMDSWHGEYLPVDYDPMPNQSDLASEDCLTLDVKVPSRAYSSRAEHQHAVLVWFHGGGYILGSKTDLGSPLGLFNASNFMTKEAKDSRQEIIYVAVNYRLGAFGFLAGDSFKMAGGFENAGFSDQRVALEWVQTHIEKFGGDPTRVTVMGQSAGASSILHHITSNGGKGRPPAFQQAILQSPTFFPRDRGKADNTYNSILKAAGVANFIELQGLSTENLMYANAKTIYRSEYGQPVYGPVVDNTYVRDLPGRLLLKGEFHKDINAMIGHNRQEGTIFTPPWIRTRKEFKAHMLKLFPHFAVTKLNYLIEKLYVIPNSPLQKHRNQQVANAIGDVAVNCNVYYLTKASNKTYNYKFNLYPGFHGQDVSYTYWPTVNPLIPVIPEQAQAMQRYFTQFIKTGEPRSVYDPAFTPYQNTGKPNSKQTSQFMSFGKWSGQTFQNEYGMVFVDDDNNNNNNNNNNNRMDISRCEFWQSAPFLDYTLESARDEMKDGVGGWWSWISDWFDFGKWKGFWRRGGGGG